MEQQPSPKPYISIRISTVAASLVALIGAGAIAAQSEVFEPFRPTPQPALDPGSDATFGVSEGNPLDGTANGTATSEPTISFSGLWNEYFSPASSWIGSNKSCDFGSSGFSASNASSVLGGNSYNLNGSDVTFSFMNELDTFLPWSSGASDPNQILGETMGAMCVPDPFAAQTIARESILQAKGASSDAFEKNKGILSYAASEEILRKATELQSQRVLSQEAQQKTAASMQSTMQSVDRTLARAQYGQQKARSTQEVMKLLLQNQAEQSALLGFVRLEQLQERQDNQLTNLNLAATSRYLQSMHNAEQAEKIAASYSILGSSFADLCTNKLCNDSNSTSSATSFMESLR
jgi:hypothetical protein